MMDKKKIQICSAILALRENKLPLPERAAVLEMKIEKWNYNTALHALLVNVTPTVEQLKDLVLAQREWASILKELDDAGFRKRYGKIHDLYAELPRDVTFSSRAKVEPPAPPALISAAQLLPSLNALRKVEGKAPLKSWKGSRATLEKEIDATRQRIESAKPEPTKAPTVVAEGAYETEEEAFAKTGHRMAGRRKSDDKADKRKQRFIEKQVPPTPPMTPRTHVIKAKELRLSKKTRDALEATKTQRAPSAAPAKANKPKGDTVSLADIARDLGMSPKIARAKARRHKAALAKLEASKYQYTPANAVQVAAILRSDARKT